MAAYRLPKATDAEKAARKEAIQPALRRRPTVPLETLRTAAEALAHAAAPSREYGNPSAASDVRRRRSSCSRRPPRGAAANVEVNLTAFDDEAFEGDAASS